VVDRDGSSSATDVTAAPRALGGRTPRAGLSAPTAITATHVRIWLGVVVGAIVIGTAGYMILNPGWRLLDALYMTVITLTTVGFREVQPLSDAARVWTMILSLAGVGLIFGSVGIVAEYFVVEATSGRREAQRMANAVKKLSGHYILCGFGRVGQTVARELVHAGRKVVVIDVLPESAGPVEPGVRDPRGRGRRDRGGDPSSRRHRTREGIDHHHRFRCPQRLCDPLGASA